MPCQLCRKKCGVPIDCQYCEGSFCPSCINLTKHDCQGAEQGVSAALGAIASYAYVSLLSDRVDKLENSTIQKEFLAPLGAAAFEVSWNNAPFAFDFDYGSTFVGFLAYKFALSTVLYQIVREMMIGDSEAFYDTQEKVYNDLSEDDEVPEQSS